MESKNNDIYKKRFIGLDIVKFIMSIVIVIYHYNFFCCAYSNKYMVQGGYLAVEVFFVISGFLLFHTDINSGKINDKGIFTIMKHKISRLYPPYILSLIIAFVLNLISSEDTLSFSVATIKKFVLFLTDALMIGEWGLPKITTTYNVVIWYVSALILAYVVWMLLFKFINGNKLRFIITLIVVVVLYAYLTISVGHLHVHGHRTAFLLLDGGMRSIAGVGCGIISYMLYLKIKNIESGKIFLITFLSFVSTLSVLFVSKDSYMDFLIIPCAILLVSFAAGYTDSSEKIGKVVAKMGNFSYFIYLNHLIVYYLTKYIYGTPSFAVYVVSVLVFSYVSMKILEKLHIQ